MKLVADSSVALAYCFEDERTPAVISVFDQIVEGGAVVPSLWRYEIANALLVAQRRGRITPMFRQEVFGQLSETPIEIDEACDSFAWTATVHFADRYGLTVYDAAYLELAQRRRLSLATLDAALARAAKAAGTNVVA